MSPRAALLALLLAVPAAAADAPAPPAYVELPPGRYSVEVRGMLCQVCARAIAAEWAKLPEVEKATADYDTGRAIVTVRLDKTLKVSLLKKTLKKAERLANLGARFELRGIEYLP